ncbi:MAG: sulfotransferase domain-containing protein [Novosphingobium sp.]|nr:sulfotransferase domain-containing protein [Novosphingobium sp.]
MMITMPIQQARAAVRKGRRALIDLQLARRVKDIDAFLVSYPKSGRTWLRYLLSIYLAKVHAVPVKLDLQTTFEILPNFDLDRKRGLPVFTSSGDGSTLPLIAVSHRSYEQRFFAQKPIIMLVRDPRDVIVSAYFHQTQHKKRFSGTIPEFIVDHQFGIKSIIDYHNGWAAGLVNSPALVISYEDLSKNTEATVRQLLGFLKIPVHEEYLREAIAGAAFDRMKKVEKAKPIPGHAYNAENDDSSRVRKGKVGGYGDNLGADDILKIENMMRDGLTPAAVKLMAHSGYSI